MVGKVWPGEVHFPDFNHPNAQKFWTEGLRNISKNYNWTGPDAIWIDMNEFSNFVNGEILTDGIDLSDYGLKVDNFSDLPFNP